MKSYIVKIELVGSNPLIWRRIIMPAGATFNRLHDAIQNSTNFKSGYPYDDCHLFNFNLKELSVSNNHQAYLDHKDYIKNKNFYIERLETMPSEYLKYEIPYQKRLKIEVRKPTTIKIDNYIENLKEIEYYYDYKSEWKFMIKLESIVDDYHFGYPTLLDGAETAPPEDIGGLEGFYEFMNIYDNVDHPEYLDVQAWTKSIYFNKYSPIEINHSLKSIHYKKTEWDKINHVNYEIVDDKYRL